MIRPPKLRRMIRYTQHFQHLSLTWLTQWSNLTSLWYGQFSLSLGKAPTFSLNSYTLKWSPVRAGAQLVRVNSDKQHGRGTATLEEKWWQDRVVTRYMGSEINCKKWGGIWDHSTGIWEPSRGMGISITVRRSGIRLSDITTKTTTFWNAPYWRNLPTFFNSVVFLQ